MITLEESRNRDEAAQLVASLDDAAQLLGGLGEGPTARARVFRTERNRGGGIHTIGNDAAQLVVNVDDAAQLVGGLSEDPAASACSLRFFCFSVFSFSFSSLLFSFLCFQKNRPKRPIPHVHYI